jgi:ABC-2 type transport system ATP-binding protein
MGQTRCMEVHAASSLDPIAVSGLSLTYPGDVHAIRSVDLSVRSGEVFALLGPNGAGKTSTVEVLEGFRNRTGGDVSVLGRDPWKAPRQWRARVGMVLQSSGTSDELSVREALELQAAYYGDARAVDDVVDLVGLGDHASVRIDRLSGGMQRRLDVGKGIIGRPELLFLDEPTTGFDPEARRQFWDLIRRLKSEGTTIVLTTHYLDEAEVLADRIAVMVAGRIVALGSPAELRGGQGDSSVVRWRENSVHGETTHEALSATPAAVVMELVARLGTDIAGLTISRPSLEDVYLQLVRAHSNDNEGSAR